MLTLLDLYKEENTQQLDVVVEHLLQRLAAEGSAAPSDTEVVIGLRWCPEDETYRAAYYLASMSSQVVFWFEEFDPTSVTEFSRIVVSESHLGVCRRKSGTSVLTDIIFRTCCDCPILVCVLSSVSIQYKYGVG